MAKKKKAKLKIPKEIAGVKVPKELRKKAKVAIALAESPVARELLAAGLTAVAAALAAKEASPDASSGGKAEAPRADAAKPPSGRRKREAFAAVAKDVALGVAAAYADEARKKKGKQNDGSVDKLEDAAH